MTYVDLHSHTIYSDGTDEPESVVRASKMNGIEVLAITDHDTMAAYPRAKAESERWNIALLPGVEVTSEHYHILGLGVEYHDKKFQDFLKHIQNLQQKVCEQRIAMVQETGLPLTMDKVKRAFPESRLGKYNLVMTMVRDSECVQYCSEKHPTASPRDLLKHYFLKEGVAGTVDKKYYAREKEVIDAIHAAGGEAVIAHPFKDVTDMNEMDYLVRLGIDRVEMQPNYGQENERFVAYALEHRLSLTYGSDYHGPAIPRPMLGREFNQLPANDPLVKRAEYQKRIARLLRSAQELE